MCPTDNEKVEKETKKPEEVELSNQKSIRTFEEKES